jgi:hypothetical protein
MVCERLDRPHEMLSRVVNCQWPTLVEDTGYVYTICCSLVARYQYGTLRHRLVYAPAFWNDASGHASGHAMPRDSCDVLYQTKVNMYKVDTR